MTDVIQRYCNIPFLLGPMYISYIVNNHPWSCHTYWYLGLSIIPSWYSVTAWSDSFVMTECLPLGWMMAAAPHRPGLLRTDPVCMLLFASPYWSLCWFTWMRRKVARQLSEREIETDREKQREGEILIIKVLQTLVVLDNWIWVNMSLRGVCIYSIIYLLQMGILLVYLWNTLNNA